MGQNPDDFGPVGVVSHATRKGHRPRLAALVTEYRKYSHGQNIIDRFLDGFSWEDRWHRPEMDVVSLYVDQFPESYLSREREIRFPYLKIYPSIAEALIQGGLDLDVDGTLLIAEHGDYPQNGSGQTLYPRYEFFCEIVEVFRASGHSVPVFCDKHLSWSWEQALDMVETSRQVGFAMMAGSSLPVCRRVPCIDLPWGAVVQEIVSVGVGGVDGYDIHSLEAMQCLVERRRGGESGVAWVQALRGDQVWQAIESGAWERGSWDVELFEACLCRSMSLEPIEKSDRHTCPRAVDLLRLVDGEPLAYRFAFNDGLARYHATVGGAGSRYYGSCPHSGSPPTLVFTFLCRLGTPYVAQFLQSPVSPRRSHGN